MRTTLTLDDDLAAQLKERAAVLKLPFKQVVNDTLRKGLGAQTVEGVPPFQVKPFSSEYAPGVDPLRLRQLDEQLQDEEILKKLRP